AWFINGYVNSAALSADYLHDLL
ncbi:unnamed protein product, partial [Allacma fusca]